MVQLAVHESCQYTSGVVRQPNVSFGVFCEVLVVQVLAGPCTSRKKPSALFTPLLSPKRLANKHLGDR